VVLDCCKDTTRIAYLAGIAAAQKSQFKYIYPWEEKCTKSGYRVYVAFEDSLSNVPKICGWATVQFANKNAYVVEISTANSRYKGVGTAIFAHIENENKVEFIYLISLPTAQSFYTKIGFMKMHQDLPYMYKTVRKDPSQQFIEAQLEKKAQQAIAEEQEMQNELSEIAEELSTSMSRRFWNYIKADKVNKYIVLDAYNSGQIESVRELLNTS
jgi:hypothetical protein